MFDGLWRRLMLINIMATFAPESLLQALFSLGTGVTLGLLFGAVSFLYATVGHSTTKRPCSHGHGHVAPSPPLLKSEKPMCGKIQVGFGG
jgi:hypothetical protein